MNPSLFSRLARILAAALVFALAGAAGTSAAAEPAADPSLSENAPEATVWYLGHCGYAVKTKSKLLIFDYIQKILRRGEPPIPLPVRPLAAGGIDPEEIKALDVVVFVSHSHGDHYDEIIHSWKGKVPKIRYIFGWDEKTGERIHSLPAPRAELKIDGMEISTVNSHHSGVPESAFLVKVDGLTIYHNGDYMGRMGGAGTPVRSAEDMAYLGAKAEAVDLMFGHAGAFEPFPHTLRVLKPKVYFPMHYGGREEKYREFAAEMKRLGEDVPVPCPVKPGDRFSYRDGKIFP